MNPNSFERNEKKKAVAKKTIVVSAVNLRKGGTLAILRDCLCYLSELVVVGNYRVVALVHKKELADYPGIEYIELPDVVKSWRHRLWCEYVTMYRISGQLFPVYLWLSLHDTTPRVKAVRQAVYCQTSFPFYRWKWNDFKFDYKIVLFALFTRFVYRIHVHRNDFLIVQQKWLRTGFSRMLGVRKEKFIVAPPEHKRTKIIPESKTFPHFTFFYASTPDCHKNFEFLCMAASLLEQEVGKGRFKVVLTVGGDENRYARWLYKKFGKISSIDFAGFMSKERLAGYYEAADCLVFPSRIETWGLPISEFMPTGKPMLLADLPYAHETAGGSRQTAFFSLSSPEVLKRQMKRLLEKDKSFLAPVPSGIINLPKAYSWKELFCLLLGETDCLPEKTRRLPEETKHSLEKI